MSSSLLGFLAFMCSALISGVQSGAQPSLSPSTARVPLPWGHQLGTTALGFVPKTGLLVKGGVPGPHCTEGLCASPSFQCLCGIKIPRGCEEVVKNNNQNPKPEEIWCWMKGTCLSTCVGFLLEGLQCHSGVSQGRVCPVTLMSTEPHFSRFWFYGRGIKTSE